MPLRSGSREANRQRPVWWKWYKLPAWQARRAGQLRDEPLCQLCKARGLVVPATVANHKTPHRGNWLLFIEGALQSVCKPCHDGVIQREEKRGHVIGCDDAGRPSDPLHPWNR